MIQAASSSPLIIFLSFFTCSIEHLFIVDKSNIFNITLYENFCLLDNGDLFNYSMELIQNSRKQGLAQEKVT